MKILLFGVLIAASAWAQAQDDVAQLRAELERDRRILSDWANLGRYRDDNAKLQAPSASAKRVVFMGDSITDAWGRKFDQSFFEGKPYINRGISGQTTPQMLIRFRPDVIDLKPKAVIILAGTNDIAGNTGPMTVEQIEENLMSMTELARANKIAVAFASVLPVCDSVKPQTSRRPQAKIRELNEWIRNYAAKNSLVYVDYYSAMVGADGMLKSELTYDCLHPNEEGYKIMGPIAEKALVQAVAKRR